MSSRPLIGSDLDGTVRRPLKLFDWMRDYCDRPHVRKVGGILAALTARRINRDIQADVFITGSPECENEATRFWLRLHGMPARVYADPERNRVTQKAYEHPSEPFKARMIKELGLRFYYENEADIAEELRKDTEAEIIHV